MESDWRADIIHRTDPKKYSAEYLTILARGQEVSPLQRLTNMDEEQIKKRQLAHLPRNRIPC